MRKQCDFLPGREEQTDRGWLHPPYLRRSPSAPLGLKEVINWCLLEVQPKKTAGGLFMCVSENDILPDPSYWNPTMGKFLKILSASRLGP